jgi:hypothetical protein
VLATSAPGPVSVNANLKLTHPGNNRQSKSDPPPGHSMASRGCRFLRRLTGLSFVLQSITLARDLYDVRMM